MTESNARTMAGDVADMVARSMAERGLPISMASATLPDGAEFTVIIGVGRHGVMAKQIFEQHVGRATGHQAFDLYTDGSYEPRHDDDPETG